MAVFLQNQRMQSSLLTSGLFTRPNHLPVTQLLASLQTPQAAPLRRHQQPALRPLKSAKICHAATMEAPPKPPAVDLPREGPKYEYNGLDIGQDIDDAYGSDTQGIPKNRRSGVILHPTSLPGPYGTGEIGQEAYRFVDWLASAGMQIWQVTILQLCVLPFEHSAYSPALELPQQHGRPLRQPTLIILGGAEWF